MRLFAGKMRKRTTPPDPLEGAGGVVQTQSEAIKNSVCCLMLVVGSRHRAAAFVGHVGLAMEIAR